MPHRRPRAAALAALLLTLAACTATSGKPDGGGPPVTQPPPGTQPPEGPVVNPGTGSPGGCLAGELLQQLGQERMLVGVNAPGNEGDAIATAAPFTSRYRYLAGGIFTQDTPCARCDASCSASWWGCWQDPAQPPGAYVRDFVAAAKRTGQLPLVTYYELLHASGVAEGEAQLGAVTNAALLRRLLNDWRFLLQQVGSERALLHFEPDFWGYTQRFSNGRTPGQLPAAVRSANPTDCAAQEDSIAGLGRCVVAMVRKYAPNAKVSLHASAWATGIDVLNNQDAALDVEAEARKVADWLLACGGAEADFITLDPLDRDAGYYQTVEGLDRWWNTSDSTLPNFAQAFRWSRALSERMNKPNLWWQIPVGNMSLPNLPNRYRDNRVEVLFARTADVVRSHGFGLAFGDGRDDQTNPTTDGDVLYGRVRALSTAGGQPPCP
ncbi:MAG TPA: hypothetical protein VFO83_10050 [Aggregicoccus sp.]|nr:hypothetical protein [Aggregicoccus sp.]